MIRRATSSDVSAVRDIWNALITDTTVTFNNVPKTEAEVSSRIAKAPVFVAETDRVVGFASYGSFRSGVGYDRIAEHSITLTQAGKGQGLGRALMNAIMNHAKANGITSLIAGVSAENEHGLAFHAHLGFVKVGQVARAGFKFGREIDLILMQKHL